MPPKSKSRKKLKQPRRARKPTPNWLDLPSDLMVNILQRVGVVDILQKAQKVCTAWREICKDPVMWRVVYIDSFSTKSSSESICQEMCKHAVDRSQGQLLDLTIIDFYNYDLLQYVADRSSQLKRLEIICYYCPMFGIIIKAYKKLSSLEELCLVRTTIWRQDIESVGRYCPLLKTLKLNEDIYVHNDDNNYNNDHYDNEIAFAIGKHLSELTHLELIGSSITNKGLQAILDGCCHLESLDLRGCLYVDLKGDLGKRCSQQIKYLKLPHDSLEGCPHIFKVDLLYDSDDEYSGYSDYDDE